MAKQKSQNNSSDIKNVQDINKPSGFRIFEVFIFFVLGTLVGLFLLSLVLWFVFEKKYGNKIYPGIQIEGVNFGGKTKNEVKIYFEEKGKKFNDISFVFLWDDKSATVSAKELSLNYNGTLLADQAFILARSGNIFTDLFLKIKSLRYGIKLQPSMYFNDNNLQNLLVKLSEEININPTDAQFIFSAGRVVVFKTETKGRKLDINKTKEVFYEKIVSLNTIDKYPSVMEIKLPINVISPKITTQQANNLGIVELIGTGTSLFSHSIPNRIYNIDLAASRINGYLIPPDSIFSFNDTVGDVSAFSGYRSAYVIKDGKTVLGDGGGVCQVSTTLFRAALNTGLPIIERWAHSYRVGYYEQNSPPGIDATVYNPGSDLKIKNDTGNYILIQSVLDKNNYQLTFNLYGQKDNRTVKLTIPKVFNQSSPPPDLYQDDPNLQKDTVKQVDFAAWGAQVSFDYTVEKKGQIIFQKNFFSNYRPWQAVFIRGTKE